MIHVHLLNHKQCAWTNNVQCEFNKVISGVPQGFVVGPILLNCFFNDFYYFIKNGNENNFAHDDTLTAFAQNFWTLTSVQESESNNAIGRFKTNKMIDNPVSIDYNR